MIALKNERVVSFSLEYQDLYWEIEPTREDLQEYRFYVERSESEAGPFVQIAGPMIDRYYLRDSSIPAISLHRVFFYRIKVAHQLSGKEFYSRLFNRRGELPLDALEIVRNEQVLFREYIGTKCWLFPRKTFGQTCPQCWDPALRKRIDDSCGLCFGTGFSGGYHYPISFWGQRDPTEKQEQLMSQNHHQLTMTSLKMGPTPFAKPLDLLIDHQNCRYRVVSVGGSARLGVPVQQSLKLQLVQKATIDDAVPLKVDLEDVELVPNRVFSNPQTLDALGEVSSSLLESLYSR